MENLKTYNPTVDIIKETEHIIIKGLWNDSTLSCKYPIGEDLSSLSNIFLPQELTAIVHNHTNSIEFIFAPLSKNDKVVGRKFDFTYNYKTYTIEYKEPSNALKTLAKGFVELEQSSDTRYRNLRLFRDFYKEDKSLGLRTFFQDRIGISFFVDGDITAIDDYVSFAKNLNFYMKYFERKSPAIIIFDDQQEKQNYKEYCQYEDKGFPTHINTTHIEPVLLDLFQVASDTPNIRLKYLFYYQVLEYCSYYYLNDDLKRKLNNIVKNPDIINNSSVYSKILVEEFKNYFKANDDKLKLEKLVSDNCLYSDISNEIIANIEYFSKDLVFDGGFVLPSLMNGNKDATSPHKDIMKSLVDRIDKIRNVLVHIRESRENKVILPTRNNNHLLIPYLFLVRRLAEVIAIKYE